MATKTAKTRNPDRRGCGKAWKKNHDAPAKVLTAEQVERRALKYVERERKRQPRAKSGPSVTMPKITWEWFGSSLTGRMNNTRRFRMIESCLTREGRM